MCCHGTVDDTVETIALVFELQARASRIVILCSSRIGTHAVSCETRSAPAGHRFEGAFQRPQECLWLGELVVHVDHQRGSMARSGSRDSVDVPSTTSTLDVRVRSSFFLIKSSISGWMSVA